MIEKNIEDREWFDLMVAERGERFWQLCQEKLFPQVMDELDETLMTQAEVKAFENERMKFGTHAGTKIGDIDRDYLDWLASQSEWHRKLNKYLKTLEYRQ